MAIAVFLGAADAVAMPEYRTIDGAGNQAGDLGAANTAFYRLFDDAYGDGISTPAGDARPNARAISEAVSGAQSSGANLRGATDYLWQWGQFLDHDIDRTPTSDAMTSPSEAFNITVPTGDPSFDPASTGMKEIPLQRSLFDPATGTGTSNPRQQTNEITSFIDGSNVYGSDAATAAALREGSGGRMKTSAGDLLPIGPDGFFMAGDTRANEQAGLTAMHTLFVREHNRLADELAAAHAGDPAWDDEKIYQEARKIVGGEMQAITYNEFLPVMLGNRPLVALDPARATDPTVSNEFATAAYRLGHSMLSPQINRVDENGVEDPLPLRDAFFNPSILTGDGIDPILRGLASQSAKEIDPFLVDDVRNFLFGPPGAGGFDLAALNIQRGRDHGLAGYNDIREMLGLARVTGFDDAVFMTGVGDLLDDVYLSVDDIDLWVGALAENHLDGAMIGEVSFMIVSDQFARLRDGDAYWYENIFDGEMLEWIRGTTLSDVIARNTGITGLQANAFLMPLPEPGSLAVFGAGLAAIAVLRRRRRAS